MKEYSENISYIVCRQVHIIKSYQNVLNEKKFKIDEILHVMREIAENQFGSKKYYQGT